MLVMLKEHTLPDGSTTLVPDRYVRASDFNGKLGQANNPEWKTLAFDEAGKVVLPNGSIGFRWGPEGRADDGKWNLEDKEARHDGAVKLKLSVLEGGAQAHDVVDVAFPYFAGADTPHFKNNPQQGELNRAKVPAVRIRLGKEGDERHAMVATVFDLQAAQYGIDRGLGSGAKNYDDNARLHARLAGGHHRRAAPAADHRGTAVRRERAQDAWQVDGHHRRGDEPLVPQRHELPRRHQPADDVRLRRPRAAVAGRTTWARRSCARRPAGRRWPSRWTGSARRGR